MTSWMKKLTKQYVITMKEKTIYALGFFDGVHRGHGALMAACRSLAAENGCRAGAVTFGTPPQALVAGWAPQLLSTPKDREIRSAFSASWRASAPVCGLIREGS